LIPIEKKKIFNEDVEKLQLRIFKTGNFGKTLKKLEKSKKRLNRRIAQIYPYGFDIMVKKR